MSTSAPAFAGASPDFIRSSAPVGVDHLPQDVEQGYHGAITDRHPMAGPNDTTSTRSLTHEVTPISWTAR